MEQQKYKKYKILSGISFISTVFNEEKSILNFLKSFFEQNYLPEEIIIVDGGSADNTVNEIIWFFEEKLKILLNNENLFNEILLVSDNNYDHLDLKTSLIRSYNIKINSEINHRSMNSTNDSSSDSDSNILKNILVKLFKSEGAKISKGRNIAIMNASNEIICVSDAGCIFDKNWIYEISKYYFLDYDYIDVVGGFSKPIAISFLERLLSMCIMPEVKEIKEEKFMPSSRNISFKKKAWQRVKGYPENMDYGEDMKFNFNLKMQGFKIKFNPDAIVYWRMRENLVQVFKQFFRYAKGDAIGKMYTYRHLIRFASFFISIVILLSAIFFNAWLLILYIPLFVGYIYKPVLRLKSNWNHIKNPVKKVSFKILSIILCPFLLLYIDVAKASGYLYGMARKR